MLDASARHFLLDIDQGIDNVFAMVGAEILCLAFREDRATDITDELAESRALINGSDDEAVPTVVRVIANLPAAECDLPSDLIRSDRNHGDHRYAARGGIDDSSSEIRDESAFDSILEYDSRAGQIDIPVVVLKCRQHILAE